MARDGFSAMGETSLTADGWDRIFKGKKVENSSIKNCELCGGNVEVVGGVTKSYKNLDKIEIEKLQECKEILKEFATTKVESRTWLHEMRGTIEDVLIELGE